MKRLRSIASLTLVLAVALAANLAAQNVSAPATTTPSAGGPTTPAPAAAVTLELPRAKSRYRAGDLPPVPASKISTYELLPQGILGASAATKQNIRYLALDAGKDWSRPLRGALKDVTFVSFLAYASEGSTINLAGARLTITGSTKAGYVKLMVGVAPDPKAAPRELTDLFKLESHDKAVVAALPVLTIRLDPVAGVWDLYMFNRLIAEDVPLVDLKGSDKKFAVHAGSQGALLFSVVDSDENPLYIDNNRNGIDDAFEKAQSGGNLLPASATAAERSKLVQLWKANQTPDKVKPWTMRRLVPDAVAASTPVK